MRIGPRAQLLLLAALFLLPIVASTLAYVFYRPATTSNYGELLLPPRPVTAQPFRSAAGAPFALSQLAGKWVLVVSDSGACDEACREKLVAVRQVRLALGRKASRVERVFVVDDLRPPSGELMAQFPGMHVALTLPGMTLPTGVANDRAHVYLVDPRGDVMMRWPAQPEAKRMLRDLDRLLRASQIG